MHTAGAAGSAIDAASIGFSTVGRQFKVPNFARQRPPRRSRINGYGFSVDALHPDHAGHRRHAPGQRAHA